MEQGEPTKKDKRRKIIILTVAIVLFVLAFSYPWYMQERHLGSLDRSTDSIGKAIAYPVKIISQGGHIGRGPRKVGLAMYGAVLLLLGHLISRKRKIAQWTINAMLCVLLVAAFGNESQTNTKRFLKGDFIQTWNVYHYYYGAKYFDEMGYFYQYAYTLKADQEGPNHLSHIKQINDLFDYKKKSPQQIVKQVEGREDFTAERWELFTKELYFLMPSQSKSQWRKMLKDHGYNGTPFWNTIGSFLANSFPITNRAARTFVLGLDQLLLLLTFVIVAVVFGFRWGVTMALYFLILFLNENYTVAGFIRYDWFCATVISFCLFSKGYFKASAPFLAYATMARIFPGFLLLGPGIQWLIDWIKNRKMDRKLFSMFVVFALCCLFFFWMGTWNRHGFGAWEQFYKNIRQHSAKHYLGPKRIGLKHMYIDDLSTPKIALSRHYASFKKQKALYRVSQFVLIAMFLAAMLRRKRNDSWLLGYMFIFAILVLSRYYWALISMFFLLGAQDRSRWRRAMGDVLLFAMIPMYYTFRFQENNPYSYYMAPTLLFFGFFVFVAGSYIVEDFWDWRDDWRAWRARRRGEAPANQTAAESDLPESVKEPSVPMEQP